jgi:hypothetical protein
LEGTTVRVLLHFRASMGERSVDANMDESSLIKEPTVIISFVEPFT